MLTGLVLTQDVATVTCGLFNAAYFAGYWWRRTDRRSRRVGAAALAVVGVAAAVEAAFSQALFWSQREAISLGLLSPGAWALIRLPLLAATAFISIIILRRLLS